MLTLNLMPCSLAGTYRRFGGSVICLVSHPRKQQSLTSAVLEYSSDVANGQPLEEQVTGPPQGPFNICS
jgi:hypothetical protein